MAETEEPLKPYEQLLEELPSEYPQAERIAAAQAAETALQQLEAAREKVTAQHLARDVPLAGCASGGVRKCIVPFSVAWD